MEKTIGLKRMFYNLSTLSQYLKKVLIVAFFTLCLCSCKRQPQITIYMGPNSIQDSTEGLRVEDGDYQAALARCQERLQQFPKDSIEAADIYSLMGGIYAEYIEDEEKARYYLDKAVDIHQQFGDDIGLAQDYVQLSHIYYYIGGKIEEGIDFIDKAESLYRKYGLTDSFGLAITLISKGRLYKKNAEYGKAIEAFKEAQEIYHKRQEEEAIVHIFTGQIYIEMQDFENAEQELTEAQKICEKKGEMYHGANVNRLFGDLYLEQESYAKAIDSYTKALDFYKTDYIYLQNMANVYSNMAYSYNHSGNLEKAIEYGVNASKAIESTGLDTKERIEDQKVYRHNLSMYYKGWTEDMSEEGFEAWYQKVVIEGEEWDMWGEKGRGESVSVPK